MSDDRLPGPDPAAFRAAFGVGASDEEIHPVDQLGVLLAALKALYCLVEQRDHEIEQVSAQVEAAENAPPRA